jgi:hypothetical protein
MSKHLLTPMLVQYLVGLCCLKWDPDAVDVTIGDMVYDPAADKERDVDITVTVVEPGGSVHAFKAYEVKRERKPLDVADVEQLCIKLIDMPSVTHRAIVSASGYTAAAQRKAARHGINLYEIRPWTRPLQEQFPALTMNGTPEECFPMSSTLLCWVHQQLAVVAPEAKAAFPIQPDTPLLDASSNPHSKYATFGQYEQQLLLRSTQILLPLEPAVTVFRTFPIPHHVPNGGVPAGPAWPHTHTLDTVSDSVHIDTGHGVHRIDQVTISGHLQYQRSDDNPLYYVIDQVPGGEAFAGALIAQGKSEGNMTALVFSPMTRDIGIHFVQLADKHLNCIRRFKLEVPSL